MKGQPIFKLFKQRPWILLPLLGLLVLGSVVVLSKSPDSGSSAVVAVSPVLASPAPTSSPALASKVPKVASSSPPASPAPTASPEAALPTDPTELTPEQQAMNQRAKAAFESSLSSVDSLIEMRVAIAEGLTSLTLSLSTNADLIDENEQHLGDLAAGISYPVQANGQTISLGSLELPALVWIEPISGGMFTLGDRTYRGRLLLAVNDGHLWGVNFVSLRQYLYSVVASEVSPSWPMEALKAQAVAARSYALTYYFKPVNSLYQMGDDERFQVYSGIDREAKPTNQAVNATAGEFVSYRGGIVESLYAASDDIVAEAFQGHGMSQLGALGLAEQGYTYEQILANYYPNTGIGRIRQDYE